MKENRTAVLNAIRDLSRFDEHGILHSPTLEEICVHLGLSPASKGSMSVRVNELVAEGFLVKTGDNRRTLAIVNVEDRRLDALVKAASRLYERARPGLPGPATVRQVLAEALAVTG